MPRATRVPNPFGEQLRHWRRRAGLAQLDLAADARTTPRYVSFIETGRSRPGRALVLRLAAALEVPLRARNALLVAAGLAPEFEVRDLSDPAMGPVRLVLDRLLLQHEPYPAWVVGRGLQFLASNRGAEALFPGLCRLTPEAIVDLWCGPGPLREMIENWPDVVRAGAADLHREATRTCDPELLELARRAEAHARTVPEPDSGARYDLPVVCPRLTIGGRTLRTVSTVMRFDRAVDVIASELRVELMFPADEDSDAYLRELVGT